MSAFGYRAEWEEVLADLLYALGFALWTGVVVVVFVQIIPEIKRRQIKRWLDDYEATLREKARAGGRPGATGEVAARVNSRQGVATQLGVYALLVRIEQRGLVDVEKVPSEKGPPRKVYSLYAQGRGYLEEFWRT